MRNALKKSFIIISKVIMPYFFDKKYLNGRWFQSNVTAGYRWCWRSILYQKILRKNAHVPWPCSHRLSVGVAENIMFHIDDLNNFQHFGCYYQAFGKGRIIIGKGSYIAPNCGIITVNHNCNHLDSHDEGRNVLIGNNCWVGMNSIILPGVILGDRCIVGAGAVVTKSFKEGRCIIAGCPAKIVKNLNIN